MYVLMDEPLMEPDLVTMQILVAIRLKAHNCALLELNVMHYTVADMVAGTEWSLWAIRGHENTQLLKWVGAKLTVHALHHMELERLYNESHRAVACMYHPDDHACLTLTGPIE